MDTAIHKGRPFWSGVFDTHDGFIREVHPYKRAAAADFHHSYYVSPQSQDAMKQGDAGFFWVDPDGSVNTDWREGKAPQHITDAIQSQIKPIHKDDGGSVGNIENHSSAIAEAMQNHFGVPVLVSKSKTPYGVSHYVKPNFDLPESETPFVVRVSDHAAWVPRLHQVEHHVYPKKTDDPRKFIGESIEAATAYGKRKGLFPKDEFVPLSGKVVHPTFGEGTVLDSKPDVAKVDFGKNGVKNISARFLQPIHKSNGGDVDGITAYHGSPHDFDEFDTSKIGTGEGAQAYGHGLYFAKSEPTAKYYKDTLAHRGQIDLEHEANQREMPMSREAMIEVRRHANGSVDPLEAAKHMHWSSIEARQYPQEKLADLIDLYRKAKQGHMYEVAIDAHPDHMLDWDKPLSEQSEHVQNVVKNKINHHIATNPNFANDDWLNKYKNGKLSGEQLYHAVYNNGVEASKDWSNSGIHGIRYLDASSRGASEQPTHNYVVFDHNRVSVKRKYAQGGDVEAYGDGGHIPVGDPRRDENLAAWHEGSHPETKNQNGTPRVFYHGTTNNFSAFNPTHNRRSSRSIFVSQTPELANFFAMPQYEEEGDVPNVMPVFVKTKNPFDYENPHHVENVVKHLSKDKDFMDDYGANGGLQKYKKEISEGKWQTIEDPWVQDAIQTNHDGFFASGRGEKFLSVYEPHQIKSAMGNNGHFDPNDTDITKAKGGTIDRENVDYKKMPHSRIVEHVLGKISAPLPALDPHLMAAIAGRRS